MSEQIQKNMLRERAVRTDEVTDEMWNEVLKEHKDLVKEFLNVNKQLSPQTEIQYTSGLRLFFWWVHIELNDKVFYKISKRDFMKYLGLLQERGLSSSAISFKKSCVSSFNNYIENVVADDVEEYKNFRNYTRGLPSIAKNQVYNKVAITEDEYKLMLETLIGQENYFGAAWVATAFFAGSRRAEIIQFKTEILNYKIPEGQNYVLSHIVRGKGFGHDGKTLKYMLNLEVLKYWKLWVDKRGYESDYIFSVKHDGKVKHISTTWANDFCQNTLSKILGRRINPHLFKSSCITNLLEHGVELSVVSKYVAQHNDTSTTSKFYDLRDNEEERNQIFNLTAKDKI
jgi:site-specific recombinase XerD